MARYYTFQADLSERLEAQGISPDSITTFPKGDHKGEFLIRLKGTPREEYPRIYDYLKTLFLRVQPQGYDFYCKGPTFRKCPDEREYYAIQDAKGETIRMGPVPFVSEDRALIQSALIFLREGPPTEDSYRMVPLYSYFDLDANAWTTPAPKTIKYMGARA